MARRTKEELLPPAPKNWREGIRAEIADIKKFPSQIQEAGFRILRHRETEKALRYLLAAGKVAPGMFAVAIKRCAWASLGDRPSSSYSFHDPKNAPVVLAALRDFEDIFRGTDRQEAFRHTQKMVVPFTAKRGRGRPRRSGSFDELVYSLASDFNAAHGRTLEGAIKALLRSTFGPGEKYDIGHLLMDAKKRIRPKGGG